MRRRRSRPQTPRQTRQDRRSEATDYSADDLAELVLQRARTGVALPKTFVTEQELSMGIAVEDLKGRLEHHKGEEIPPGGDSTPLCSAKREAQAKRERKKAKYAKAITTLNAKPGLTFTPSPLGGFVRTIRAKLDNGPFHIVKDVVLQMLETRCGSIFYRDRIAENYASLDEIPTPRMLCSKCCQLKEVK